MAITFAELRAQNPAYNEYSDDDFLQIVAGGSGMDPAEIAELTGYSIQQTAEDIPLETPDEVIESLPAQQEQKPEFGSQGGFDAAVNAVVQPFQDLGQSLDKGIEDTWRNIRAGGNVALANVTGNRSYNTDVEANRQEMIDSTTETPAALDRFHKETAAISEDDPWYSQIGQVAKAGITNPEAIPQLVASQIPNAVGGIGGAIAGAKGGAAAGAAIGSVFPGAGTAIGATIGGIGGAAAGMFLGTAPIEIGAKGIEKAEGGFTSEESEEAFVEGAIKSGVITAVDLATLKTSGYLMGKVAGPAMEVAKKAEAKVLLDAGVDVSSDAAMAAARKANPQVFAKATQTAGEAAAKVLTNAQKAKIAGIGLTAETLGEGLGEYTGELVATGEASVVDAAVEAIAGFSQSSVETAYNYNKLNIDIKNVQAKEIASQLNAQKSAADSAAINSASTVDEAINASNEAANSKPITSRDVWDDTAAKADLLKQAELVGKDIPGETVESTPDSEATTATQETHKLFRGTKGQTKTVGDALFYSPDRSVAESFAGSKGKVEENEVTFSNLLKAENWAEAKQIVGLPKSADLDTLVRKAAELGHDGVTFNSKFGREFVVIPSNMTKGKSDTAKNKPTFKKVTEVAESAGIDAEINRIRNDIISDPSLLNQESEARLTELSKRKSALQSEIARAKGLTPTVDIEAQAKKQESAAVEIDDANIPEGAFEDGVPDEDAPMASFAGRKAKGADLLGLADANRRMSKGEDGESIRQDLGWHKGADNKWRFEIDDSKMSVHENISKHDALTRTWADVRARENLDDKVIKVKDIIKHDKLFKAYPEVAEIEVESMPGAGAAYSVDGETGKSIISLGNGIVGADNIAQTLMHEIQHGIQNIEGFARGGSPEGVSQMKIELLQKSADNLSQDVLDGFNVYDNKREELEEIGMSDSDIKAELSDLVAEIDKKHPGFKKHADLIDLLNFSESDHKAYSRLAGEVEARNVEDRLMLTPEVRKLLPPDSTQDTKTKDQIVAFRSKEAAREAESQVGGNNPKPIIYKTTVADVEAAIAGLRKAWKNENKIVVVNTLDDLKSKFTPSVFEKISKSSDGLYSEGKDTVYLVADRIPSADRARWVAVHEFIGHGGLRALDGPLSKHLALAGSNKFVQELSKKIAADRNQDYDLVMHLDEAIAELAAASLTGQIDKIFDKYGIVVPEGAYKRVEGVIARVVEAIKKFIADQFGRSANFEVRDLIEAARKAQENRGTDMMGNPQSEKVMSSFAGKESKTASTKADDQVSQSADSDTITVDGVERSTVNSDGKKIHPTKEGIENFWKWFGDSKIVDEYGNPQVVYHGTGKSFDEVKQNKGAQGIFWFSSSKEDILSGSAGASSVNEVMPLYVKIDNPATWSQYDQLMLDEFKSRGLDGAKLDDSDGVFNGFTLDPNQVKSVSNSGAFNPESPKLAMSRTKESASRIRGISADEVRSGIESLSNVFADNVEVVQSYRDIVEAVGTGIHPKADGIYFSNKVYLIADNIPSVDRARWIAIHEAVGHGGFQALPQDLYGKLNLLASNKHITNLSKAIAKDRNEVYDRDTHLQEAFAETAAAYLLNDTNAIFTRYGLHVPSSQVSRISGIIQGFVNALRKFLGMHVNDFSDKAVQDMVRAANIYAKEARSNDNGPMQFSRMQQERLEVVEVNVPGVGKLTTFNAPEYKKGDLAKVKGGKGVPAGPVRLKGINHLVEGAKREPGRVINKTGDLKIDSLSTALNVLRDVNTVYKDTRQADTYVFVDANNNALVTRFDNGAHYITTQFPARAIKPSWKEIGSTNIKFPVAAPLASVAEKNTITVDGVERSTVNSNGKPIHYTKKGIENFWKWFGDSNSVDADGRPLELYHATTADISSFDPEQTVQHTKSGKGSFYLSTSPKAASSFVVKDDKKFLSDGLGFMDDANVMPVYARTLNPLKVNAKGNYWREIPYRGKEMSTRNLFSKALDKGMDSLIVKDVHDTFQGQGGALSDIHVISNPSDIKSATGNKGKFSGTEDNILESRATTFGQTVTPTTPSVPEMTRTEKFRVKAQDAQLRWKTITKWLGEQGTQISDAANVYERENLSKGKRANKMEDFRRDTLEPLIKDIAETSKRADAAGRFSLSDVADYLEAKHIPEANKQMRKIHGSPNATANGISDQVANAVVARFQAMPNFSEFEALAERMRKIGTDSLEMRLNAGLISQEKYDLYKKAYKHWVPLRGDMQVVGVGKGMSTNAKEKRRMGHKFREQEFVMENLIQDHEKAIMQIEKNKVGLSIAQFLLEAQNDDIGTISKPEKKATLREWAYAVKYQGRVLDSFQTETAAKLAVANVTNGSSTFRVAGQTLTAADLTVEKVYDPSVIMMAKPTLADNEIQVYVNGETIRLQLNDPGLAAAATNSGVSQVGSIVHGARTINRFLSTMYTAYSPDFLLTNMARDMFAGTVVLTGKKGIGFTGKVAKNYIGAFRDLVKGRNDPNANTWVKRYRDAGGNIGAAYLDDLERVGQDAMAELQKFAGPREAYKMVLKQQKADGASDKKAHTMALLKAGTAGAKNLPILRSIFPFIETANKIIENTLRLATFKTAIETGSTEQEAATLSKDLMNFNRSGEMANQMGALYLFYNPGAQGIHIFAEAMTSSPHRKQAQAMMGAWTFLSFMIAEATRALGDDDEWENIPDHVKNRNLVFMVGDTQLTLPTSYGFGIAATMGNTLSDINHGLSLPDASLRMVNSMFDNFSVLGSPISDEGDIQVDQVMPTLIKLAAGPSMNRNSFGSRISPEKFDDSVPDSATMSKGIRGSAYADLAEYMNNATGGTRFASGAIDVSPDVIKYWVTSLFGGAGRFLSDSVTGTMDIAAGIKPELENVPVARRFARTSGLKDSRQAFWKASREVSEADGIYKRAVKAGDRDYAINHMSENKPLIQLMKFSAAAKKQSSAQRDYVLNISTDENLSRKEKALRIKEVEMQEKKVYDNFIKSFREIK